MYKNYIFDLYGTLVDIHTNEEKDELWKKMSIFYSFYGAKYDSHDLKAKYNKYYKKMVEVSGEPEVIEIDLEDVFFQLFQKKGVKPKKKVVREAARTFRLISLERLELYPYAMNVLKELKEKDKKLYLLTNAQACFTRNELVALGLDEMFDGIYISSEVGIKKPAKAAFNSIISDNKLDLKKTVMIGNDYSTDIVGANIIGMDSIYIKSNNVNEIDQKISCKFTIKSGDLREIIEATIK